MRGGFSAFLDVGVRVRWGIVVGVVGVGGGLGHADLLEIPAYYERFYAYFAPGSGIAEGRLNVADMPLDQLWVLQDRREHPHRGRYSGTAPAYSSGKNA